MWYLLFFMSSWKWCGSPRRSASPLSKRSLLIPLFPLTLVSSGPGTISNFSSSVTELLFMEMWKWGGGRRVMECCIFQIWLFDRFSPWLNPWIVAFLGIKTDWGLVEPKTSLLLLIYCKLSKRSPWKVFLRISVKLLIVQSVYPLGQAVSRRYLTCLIETSEDMERVRIQWIMWLKESNLC